MLGGLKYENGIKTNTIRTLSNSQNIVYNLEELNGGINFGYSDWNIRKRKQRDEKK